MRYGWALKGMIRPLPKGQGPGDDGIFDGIWTMTT